MAKASRILMMTPNLLTLLPCLARNRKSLTKFSMDSETKTGRELSTGMRVESHDQDDQPDQEIQKHEETTKPTPDLSLKELEMIEKNPIALKRSFSGETTFNGAFGNLEKHYCSTCYIDQPIRSKHCKSCRICVATFDHHCFWIGNCIGEKNRPSFMVYLFLQVLEMAFLIGKPWIIAHNTGYLKIAASHPLLTTVVLIYFFLLLGLLSLLAYHLRFMANNITTWEYLSWNEITYLEGYEQKEGSAFSISTLANICMYMRPHSSSFYDWVPTKPRK
jgi:hypothetical protein